MDIKLLNELTEIIAGQTRYFDQADTFAKKIEPFIDNNFIHKSEFREILKIRVALQDIKMLSRNSEVKKLAREALARIGPIEKKLEGKPEIISHMCFVKPEDLDDYEGGKK